jgi:hypothetical protein
VHVAVDVAVAPFAELPAGDEALPATTVVLPRTPDAPVGPVGP